MKLTGMDKLMKWLASLCYMSTQKASAVKMLERNKRRKSPTNNKRLKWNVKPMMLM